ncbi:MAG TPA: DUF4129 domain-containing protein [Gemmatimonadales bacterium]|nr:DUF4129 domain-containing protein [Gemmatimonadales bacterium]
MPPDSLREAIREVFARADYRWATGRSPLEWLFELVARLLGWLRRTQESHPDAFRWLLVGLSVLLVALLAHMSYVVWRIARPTVRTPTAGDAPAGLLLEDARAHRTRADELARAGRYAEALAHRFVAVLLDLDRRQAVKFHPSKTPAEYLDEARLDPTGRTALADLVAQLYRHVFGAVPCDERSYREFAAEADLVFEHVAAA